MNRISSHYAEIHPLFVRSASAHLVEPLRHLRATSSICTLYFQSWLADSTFCGFMLKRSIVASFRRKRVQRFGSFRASCKRVIFGGARIWRPHVTGHPFPRWCNVSIIDYVISSSFRWDMTSRWQNLPVQHCRKPQFHLNLFFKKLFFSRLQTGLGTREWGLCVCVAAGAGERWSGVRTRRARGVRTCFEIECLVTCQNNDMTFA